MCSIGYLQSRPRPLRKVPEARKSHEILASGYIMKLSEGDQLMITFSIIGVWWL